MRTRVIAAAISVLIGNLALAADKAGYALLDKMVAQLNQMADASKTSEAEVSNVLNELMALAKQAKTEKRVDETFFRRYTRVLTITRLVVIDKTERVLVPLAEREFAQFIKDVTGASVTDKTLVIELAKAITQELDDLKRYLDAR